jgi:uncharacterized BrkB/YihY/UPF0761 family membrane protein
VTAQALKVLYSVEPAVQTFNLLSIGVCFGLLSPVLAVAALVVFVYLMAMHHTLGSPGADDTGRPHAVHRLPVACIAALLLVHTMYVVFLLAAAENIEFGLIGAAINWLMFGAMCWWCITFVQSPLDSHLAKTGISGDMQCQLTLTEPLLEPKFQDVPLAESAL